MGAPRKYDWDLMADGTLQFVDFDPDELVKYGQRLRGSEYRFMSACRTHAARVGLLLKTKRGPAVSDDEGRVVRVWYQFVPDETKFAAFWATVEPPPPPSPRRACPLCAKTRCGCNQLPCGRCGAVGTMGTDGRCTTVFEGTQWAPELRGTTCGETERYSDG